MECIKEDIKSENKDFIKLNTPTQTEKPEEKKKKKKNKNKNKNKCHFKGCNKKLSFIDKQMTCKCGHNFCKIHRHINSHNCSANHMALNQKYLTKNNPIVIPSKITAL